jgi:hypothetical protein
MRTWGDIPLRAALGKGREGDNGAMAAQKQDFGAVVARHVLPPLLSQSPVP